MSLIELLFPQRELEALGNKWHEPAAKKTRLDSGMIARGGSDLKAFLSHQDLKEQFLPQRLKQSQSEPQSSNNLYKNRTDLTNQHLPEHAEATEQESSHQEVHLKDGAWSWVAAKVQPRAQSHSHPVDSQYSSAEICDQFRSGPFGHIFDALRLTEQERDLMEELAQMNPQARSEESSTCSVLASSTTHDTFPAHNIKDIWTADEHRKLVAKIKPSVLPCCSCCHNALVLNLES